MQTHTAKISGQRLAYYLGGCGAPSSVLISGHNTPVHNWSRVVSGLSRLGTVFAYDRPGTGASDAAMERQKGCNIIELLLLLLPSLNLSPPYIVVGHSLGGLYINLLARLYPDKIAGVVLIEAGHPQQASQPPEKAGLSAHLLSKLIGLFGEPEFKRDPNSEFNGVNDTVAQISVAPEFPHVPLTVISGKKKMPFVPDFAFKDHQKWQKELARLTPDSRHLIAQQSGHCPQVSEPDFVVKAISDLVKSLEIIR